MLIEKMHNAANSGVVKFILGLITVSFLVGGMSGSLFSSNDNFAAKVNGEVISQQAFNTQYNRESERLSLEGGVEFFTKMESPEFVAQLRQDLVNRLIDQELLRQYTQELKLNVTDDMIKRAIIMEPGFQTDGKFDNTRYQQFLKQSGLTANAYADILRETLTLNQMQQGLTNSEFVVPSEVNSAAALLLQQRKARILPLSLHDEMTKQTVSADEMKAFYDANTKMFTQPEQVKVQYISLTGANVEKSMNVTEAEIDRYYQDNKAQFMTQHLAHIQLASQQEAEAVYQELQNGANFAELAKSHSTDKISGVKGGDLGWATSGQFPTPFEDTAAKLNVGEYSRPVNIDGNYHIIFLAERQEQPLAEVRNQIEQSVRRSQLESRYYALEKEMREKAFEESKSLSAAAQVAGLTVAETGYFSRNDVPDELNYPNVISALFESDISNGGVNSEPINVDELHAVVVRVLDHKAEGVRSFDESKANIETRLKRQKAQAVLTESAEELVKRLNAQPTNVAERNQFGAEQIFSLNSNQDPVLTEAVFAMKRPAGNPIYGAAQDSQGNIVVIELLEVQDGNLSESQTAQFSSQLLQAQQLALQGLLINALREKAQIEINEPFINQNEDSQ